jgi:membrane protein YdbS with pleckstrin-like domain
LKRWQKAVLAAAVLPAALAVLASLPYEAALFIFLPAALFGAMALGSVVAVLLIYLTFAPISWLYERWRRRKLRRSGGAEHAHEA